jgi:hypothetical protein
MKNNMPKPLTDKEKLLYEIQHRKVMKTSDVLRWGSENYSNRAERNMRQLAKEGKVVRMGQLAKQIYFGPIGEDAWEIVK